MDHWYCSCLVVPPHLVCLGLFKHKQRLFANIEEPKIWILPSAQSAFLNWPQITTLVIVHVISAHL